MTERGYSMPSRKLIKQINEEFRLKTGKISLPPLLLLSRLFSRLAAPVFVLVYTLKHTNMQMCKHTHINARTDARSQVRQQRPPKQLQSDQFDIHPLTHSFISCQLELFTVRPSFTLDRISVAAGTLCTEKQGWTTLLI